MEEEKNNPKFGFIVSKAVYRDSREGRVHVLEICDSVEQATIRLRELYHTLANSGKNGVSWQYLNSNPAVKAQFNNYINNHDGIAYIATAVVEVTKENSGSVKF